VREVPSPNLYTNGTFKVPRKAKKRTLPWDLKARKRNHLAPPQDQDTRARKRPRHEEPLSASTEEVATKISALNISVRLPPPNAAPATHADSDPAMDVHLNARATGAPRRWTTDENTRLKKAVLVHTHDGKTQNWDAIAALVPGRTKSQCKGRRYDAFDPRIVRTSMRIG
jgi:hypothetical protein